MFLLQWIGKHLGQNGSITSNLSMISPISWPVKCTNRCMKNDEHSWWVKHGCLKTEPQYSGRGLLQWACWKPFKAKNCCQISSAAMGSSRPSSWPICWTSKRIELGFNQPKMMICCVRNGLYGIVWDIGDY